MKLRIEALDDPESADSLVSSDFDMHLQRKVAEHFAVYPVHSRKGCEDFGNEGRLTHYTFGYSCAGSPDDLSLVAALYAAVWDDLKNAWPRGSAVMWRWLPELAADQEMGAVKLTLRIGSFNPPMRGKWAKEGFALPKLIHGTAEELAHPIARAQTLCTVSDWYWRYLDAMA